jgi:hypothetical protein
LKDDSTAMNRIDAYHMIQRRAAQAMAAHESPRTTKHYDRTGDEITLDEVERITI